MDEDKRVWPHDNSGDFTIKSFVRLCQGDHPKYPLLKRIWSAYIPTKVSFFIWKLLHGAIATDTAIKSCNVPLASRCQCCSLPSIETNHHLFLYSELAKELWRHFNTVFDIKWPRFYNLSTIIGLWFRHGIKGSLEQLCFTITPLLILWEVWKERSARRYEENYTPLSSQSLIFKIRFWILRMGEIYITKHGSSSGFKKVALALGVSYINPPIKPPLIIYWSRPPENFICLNTDGASLDKEAAGGGLIRDVHGRHLYNFFSYYGEGSNNLAETRAFLEGLQACKSKGFLQVQIQSDSMLAVNWFHNTASIP
ncbi:Ribonuclease h domain, partial [Thalictrum thalictroides]